jgi:hypothetical protein
MKYKRLEPGCYQSEDGRIKIVKESYDHFTGRRYIKQIVWFTIVDGKQLLFCDQTKKDAIARAERKLQELSK